MQWFDRVGRSQKVDALEKDVKEKTNKVIVLTDDSEMEIASALFHLIDHLGLKADDPKDITVIDNCSKDRTTSLVSEIGVRSIQSTRKKKKLEIVKMALETGKKDRKDTLIILDLTGGNGSADAISLIGWSQEEGERFASAYIYPPKGGNSVGCWAIDTGLLGLNVEAGLNVEETLFELASKSELELLAIRENIISRSKKKRGNILRMLPRSPLSALSQIVRFHPLFFYSILGSLTLLASIVLGFYTLEYAYTHRAINYFPALLTATLVMVGGFLFVAGLMLNTLYVLVEKLEAMRKWMD